MKEKNLKKFNFLKLLMLVIIIMIIVFIFLIKLDIIKFKKNNIEVNNGSYNVQEERKNISNEDEQVNDSNELEKFKNEVNTIDTKINYDNESFIGCYQLLNNEYFSISKYDSSKYSTLDLEIQLLANGIAKVAYRLNDNGNYTYKQYDANYVVEKVSEMEVNSDHYKVLKLEYTSEEAKKDSVIMSISNNITYNPANNPSDGTQAFPKSLVMRGGFGNIITYMVKKSEIKLIK